MNKLSKTLLIASAIALTACGGDDGEEKVYTTFAEGPQDIIPADYCEKIQTYMASTTMPVVNEVHQNYDSFVKSKPAIEPLTSHQYIHYLPLTVNGQPEEFPAVVSCKLKTADRIQGVHGDDKAGEEQRCSDIIKRDVEQVVAEMAAAGIANNNSNYLIDEDEVSRIGPKWLNPWPYETAVRDAENILHFRSKALLVPYSVLIPMPDRFKGTHYCHLPTKQYIQAVLTDAITAPDNFE
ncbi:hypothetical protein [Oceanicoccus sagamiensis]|uniref:Uncharacterized protein n=1 Tax=Oceanicoccus sagamiensis TaxID=716816 RepID=A0A1X9N8H2_9GAMM|nr:hypothetical protein [Oceanicoccus sagamiensis]ARN73384.1 hypothetical protein BST96_04220 [Oceanicoccus sagamiensis]